MISATGDVILVRNNDCWCYMDWCPVALNLHWKSFVFVYCRNHALVGFWSVNINAESKRACSRRIRRLQTATIPKQPKMIFLMQCSEFQCGDLMLTQKLSYLLFRATKFIFTDTANKLFTYCLKLKCNLDMTSKTTEVGAATKYLKPLRATPLTLAGSSRYRY